LLVQFAGYNFIQINGIPQGGNASPILADLTLMAMEYKYMKPCKIPWLRKELSIYLVYIIFNSFQIYLVPILATYLLHYHMKKLYEFMRIYVTSAI